MPNVFTSHVWGVFPSLYFPGDLPQVTTAKNVTSQDGQGASLHQEKTKELKKDPNRHTDICSSSTDINQIQSGYRWLR